jgi:hypothetical protein
MKEQEAPGELCSDGDYGDDDSSDDDYIPDGAEEEDDSDGDEVNSKAYEEEGPSTGLQKSEQAGVLHLVHGWTQRARVRDVGVIIHFLYPPN